MLEITTELLEHYLRATGTQYDRAKLAALIAKDGIDEAAFMYLDIVGVFRLGLCAAAEDNFREARSNFDEGSPRHEVLVNQGDRFLEMATISPLAWESARKR